MSTRDTRASTRGSRPRRMGRPPMADREAIIAAALGIGFARLTMPAVAERLGISHSTLYRYFPSRDALAAAAADHAVDAIEWPEPEDDWRAFLTATAWAHWQLFATRPGLAQEITALRLTGPGLVGRENRTGVALLGYGFSAEDSVLIMDMLAELVTQAFLAVLPQGSGGSGSGDGPGGGPDDGAAAAIEAVRRPDDGAAAAIEAVRERRRELLGPWMHTFDPRLRGVLADAVAGSPAAWFERKLDLFLDGVAGRRH
ncbi:TetR/AcrR family transcriptional regulator [Streptomyces anulatus]|uniref:TetR/AcrR family transcriptional regulator n=1 Tax=Streptomyces anulatus TaxID=1892 RepID=UPI0036BA220D